MTCWQSSQHVPGSATHSTNLCTCCDTRPLLHPAAPHGLARFPHGIRPWSRPQDFNRNVYTNLNGPAGIPAINGVLIWGASNADSGKADGGKGGDKFQSGDLVPFANRP